MDALARADAALARARCRAHVVTPDDATSPMDAAATIQIPRLVVAEADPRQDTETTVVLPAVDGWGPRPSH